MKKTLAYVATAMLLGFVIMMLPLALETGPPTYQPRLEPLVARSPTEVSNAKSEDSPLLLSYGLARQPSSLLPSSLILFSGLIAALGAYAILKRRIV